MRGLFSMTWLKNDTNQELVRVTTRIKFRAPHHIVSDWSDCFDEAPKLPNVMRRLTIELATSPPMLYAS